MKLALDYIKVNWHCLVKTYRIFKKDYHQVCSTEISSASFRDKKYYCSCGYNNNGINWHEENKKLGLK